MKRVIALLCTLLVVGCQSETDDSQPPLQDTVGTDTIQQEDSGSSDAGSDAGVEPEIDTGPPIELEGLDSDEDGLPDEAEAIVGTDPQNPDSDGDGLQDGDEFKKGSNPIVVELHPRCLESFNANGISSILESKWLEVRMSNTLEEVKSLGQLWEELQHADRNNGA